MAGLYSLYLDSMNLGLAPGSSIGLRMTSDYPKAKSLERMQSKESKIGWDSNLWKVSFDSRQPRWVEQSDMDESLDLLRGFFISQEKL